MVKIMTDKKRNVPQLRFRGFTETWEQRSLGDYADLKGRIGFRGYTRNDIIPKEKGGILTFSPTNIINGQINNNSKNTYITELKYNESPEIKVKNNDILFVKTGSTLGKSSLVENLQEPATINPQIVIIKSKVGNEHFLAIYLQTAQLLRQVHALKIGGAVPTLTEAEIKTFTINIPKAKAEASQISALFNRLDKLIALHQRKQNQFKKVKKALLQKMFADEKNPFPFIRFKGFTEAWEQRKLGTAIKIIKDKNKNQHSYRAFSISNIKGFIAQDEQFGKDNTYSKTDKSTNYIVKPGMFAYNPARINVGSIAYQNQTEPVLVSSLYEIFQTNSKIDDSFLMNWFKTSLFNRQIKRLEEGGVRQYFFIDKMKETEIKLPSISEQNQISKLLQLVNKNLDLHQRKLDQLQKLKKSLLQNMFI